MRKRGFVGLIVGLLVLGLVGVWAQAQMTGTVVGTGTDKGDLTTLTAGSYDIGDVWSGGFFGEPDTGTVYTVEPEHDYTGDLVVRVELVNYAQLRDESFDALVFEVQLKDSGGSTMDTKYVSLSQPVRFLALDYGAGWNSDYTVEVTGGNYLRRFSVGTVAPVFVADVSQK